MAPPSYKLDSSLVDKPICNHCKHGIPFGMLRLGVGKKSTKYFHWGCVTDKQMVIIRDVENLIGYNLLEEKIQKRVKNTIDEVVLPTLLANRKRKGDFPDSANLLKLVKIFD